MKATILLIITTALLGLSPLKAQFSLDRSQTFGGSDSEHFLDAEPTSDGGLIVLGYTGSKDQMVSCTNINNGSYPWLLKLDSQWNIECQQCNGGSLSEDFTGLDTFNGNILMAGRSGSSDGDVVGSYSKADDIWLVEVDTGGEIVSTRIIGSKYHDRVNAIKVNIAVGATEAEGYDIKNYYGGYRDGIIFELGNSPSGLSKKDKVGTNFEVLSKSGFHQLIIRGNNINDQYKVELSNILGIRYNVGKLDPNRQQLTFSGNSYTKGIYIITIRQGDTGEIVFTKKVFVH